jgi:two-component system chemotaxis sensor kinase CheA
MSGIELSEDFRIFLLESYELLDASEQGLLRIEQNPHDDEALKIIFRAVHTVKGNSGFLGLRPLEEICHAGESLLDLLRCGKLIPNRDVTSILLNLVDTVRDMLNELENNGRAESPASELCLQNLNRLRAAHVS